MNDNEFETEDIETLWDPGPCKGCGKHTPALNALHDQLTAESPVSTGTINDAALEAELLLANEALDELALDPADEFEPLNEPEDMEAVLRLAQRIPGLKITISFED